MSDLQHTFEQLLYRNAELCDRQDWDAYLDMFTDDSEFHLPQWDSEHVYTIDPHTQMSLIWYPNRAGLEDRVFRLRTGKAASANPLPRTLHQISNVQRFQSDEGVHGVRCAWSTFFQRHNVEGHFFGHATYHLRSVEGQWKIARKHVLLLNDRINAVLDFYHL